MIKKYLLTLAALFAGTIITPAATVGTDNAANAAYGAAPTWNSGTNGGAGFGSWSLTVSGTGSNSGFFRGDSTAIGSPGADINTSGLSFGLYSQSPAGDVYANASRSFDSALTSGQVFSIDIAVNYLNGNKGIDLKDGSNTTIFNLNIGSDAYSVGSASTGNGNLPNQTYDQNTKFTLTFVQTTLSGGTWLVTRGGALADSASGTFAGNAAGFNLYVATTSSNSGSPNDFYANNLSIVPEPSTVALLLGSSALGGLYLLRRKRA